MQRLFALVLAVFFLGLAGLMASVTFFVRDPIPVVSARTPLIVSEGEAPGEGLRATFAVDPAFRFEISGEGARGGLPEVLLRRGEGEGNGSDIEVEVSEAAEGVFQGRGQITAPGRWTLVLAHDGDTLEAPFILQE